MTGEEERMARVGTSASRRVRNRSRFAGLSEFNTSELLSIGISSRNRRPFAVSSLLGNVFVRSCKSMRLNRLLARLT